MKKKPDPAKVKAAQKRKRAAERDLNAERLPIGKGQRKLPRGAKEGIDNVRQIVKRRNG